MDGLVLLALSIASLVVGACLVIAPLIIWRNTNVTNILLAMIVKELRESRGIEADHRKILDDIGANKNKIRWF